MAWLRSEDDPNPFHHISITAKRINKIGDGDDIDSIKEVVNYCCPNGAGCLHQSRSEDQNDYGFDKAVSYLELYQASHIRTRLR